MRIVHFCPDDRASSGINTFCTKLNEHLCKLGVDSRIIRIFEDLATPHQPPTTILHIHEMWLPSVHRAAVWARQNGVPIVWSTHGMTAPWSMRHKWWKKWPVWWLYQKRDLQRAALIHCTSEREVAWNRRHGFGRFIVAPLGTEGGIDRLTDCRSGGVTDWRSGELTDWRIGGLTDCRIGGLTDCRSGGLTDCRSGGLTDWRIGGLTDCRIGGAGDFRVLFVGRIYPVKGLMNLVRAIAIVNQSISQPVNQSISQSVNQSISQSVNRSISQPVNQSISQSINQSVNLSIRIVGPDEAGHRAELEAECARLGVTNVEFVGEKHGAELQAEYAGCDVLALPSFTENFGGVVVDALAHGKPVIASRFTPWQELEDKGCGWWVDNAPESLAKTIAEAANLPREKLVEMGEKGRKLVEAKYTWQAVAKAMVEGYERAVELRKDGRRK